MLHRHSWQLVTTNKQAYESEHSCLMLFPQRITSTYIELIMPKKVIYEREFFTRDVMCLEDCGMTVDNTLHRNLPNFISSNLLPDDAEMMTDIVPYIVPEDDEEGGAQEVGTHFSGINKILITVISEKSAHLEKEQAFSDALKNVVDRVGHELLSEEEFQQELLREKNTHVQSRLTYSGNWKNIVINVLVLAILIGLSIALPSSLPLTVSLMTLSFLTTAYTSRHYLAHFWRGIRTKQWFSMSTGVSGGWVLSLTHALYHVITMPSMVSFSMTFMNVGMPVMLITFVNILDEIQHYIARATSRMKLQGLHSLYDLRKPYLCYEGPENNLMNIPGDAWVFRRKSHLKKGMLICIKPGECVPVNGKIVQGESLVDTSIRDGETQHFLYVGDDIPGGAINLGQDLVIQAESTAYRSAMNSVILKANRPQMPASTSATQSTIEPKFTYLYGALIFGGIVVSILVPALMGFLSLPLALQIVTGILFAVCPCTIVIAHRLPRLWLQYYLGNTKGIGLRDEQFLHRTNPIHTVVFDKTGTLTAGSSEMLPPIDKFSAGLWERIYLAEREYGAGHPLARAICQYIEPRLSSLPLIREIDVKPDMRHRGLAGCVQGVHIQIGRYDYLAESGVNGLPPKDRLPSHVQAQIDAGYTPIYVAESGKYKGAIFVKHAVDAKILAALKKFKNNAINPVKLVLMTGDTDEAAKRFAQQCGGVFDVIHAGKEPNDKETIIKELMKTGYDFVPMSSLLNQNKNKAEFGKVYISDEGNYVVRDHHGHIHTGQLEASIDLNRLGDIFLAKHFDGSLKIKKSILQNIGISPLDPSGIWFVGDGLNDAPCARMVSEEGGISCAMHDKDKAAFFTDISLNGSLKYLFEWRWLNSLWKHNIRQNQGLLVYGALILPVLLICLPIAGAGMVPLIPLLIMLSTTFLILFNTYRMQVAVDVALDDSASWVKRSFASKASLALLVSGSALLVASLLVMTFASGHLMLPALVFSAGTATAVSSGLLLTAIVFLSGFTSLALAHLLAGRFLPTKNLSPTAEPSQTTVFTKTTQKELSLESTKTALSFAYSGLKIRSGPSNPDVAQRMVDNHPGTDVTQAMNV